MTPAAQFQSEFVHALLAPVDQPPSARSNLFGQPAFAVYRNTVMKGCVDALEANFPAVARLVGQRCFRALALDYARWQPPDDERLLGYGRSFPDFLELCEASREAPCLASVARLDRAWIEAHVAADATTDCGFLAALAPEELGATQVALHPATRWCWCAALPIFTIWSRNRSLQDAAAADLDWRGEGVVLTRPGDAVLWRAASEPECVFLDACAQSGRTSLADAAAAAIGVQPAVELGGLLAGLLRAGALTFPARPLTGSPS